MELFGGIEAGGTKFVCTVADVSDPSVILAEDRFATTTPVATIGRCLEFFAPYQDDLRALGVASFGPIDLDPASATYGYITTTPKAHWHQSDLLGPLRAAHNVPIGFDTDVNAAAVGEQRWGAAVGLDTFCYFTIGTGIGGGAVVNGAPLHGVLHPEMGHVVVSHDPTVDPFAGVCPYHGNCFEGMASGPAIEKRWGARAETLPPDHAAWALEAHYIADALRSVVCVLSPQRVILGGGVMNQVHILPMVRERLLASLNGYLAASAIVDDIDNFVVAPALGSLAGSLGAIALAADAHAAHGER